jgi:hypothetical protein
LNARQVKLEVDRRGGVVRLLLVATLDSGVFGPATALRSQVKPH